MDPGSSNSGFWLTVAACLVALPLLVLVGIGIGERGESAGSTVVVPVAAPRSVPPSRDAVKLSGDDRAGVAPQIDSGAAPASEPASGEPVSARPVVSIIAGQATRLRDSPGGEIVATVEDRTQFGSPTVFSVRRVRGDWLGVPTALRPNGELGWIKADRDVMTAGYTNLRIVVDLSSHRAELFQGGRLLRDWTVTVGAPGSETPTGRFSITDLFEGDLNPAYGCCAVALSATQPNLPSGWAGGNLIAFHGTDGPLGVDASHGCIRSADRDVRALVERVPLGTPVRIRA